MYESKKKYFYGTGRRKSSVARVRVYENGTGSIIINAKDAVLTGKKLEQKYYRTHSGWVGGLKETQYKHLMANRPELAMRLAVRGMLQKNTIAQWQLKRLRVFAGAEHTHAAQKPEVWDR